MKKLIQIIAGLVVLLVFSCASRSVMANAQNSVATEFVGSTPADALPREFLGGLAANALCHYIKWELALSTNQSTGLPATYKLNAQYHVPVRSNPNQSEEGPKVTAEGTWEIVKDAKSGAAVYRINSEKTGRSLSFVKVGENLIHMLDQDRNLMIGNGGWSYTLNRAGHAERVVPPSVARTVPDLSYPISRLATGSVVFAVFEGRSPCHGIARELNLPQHEGCHKVKWRVTLYKHPETSAPATYKVEGTFYRQLARRHMEHGARHESGWGRNCLSIRRNGDRTTHPPAQGGRQHSVLPGPQP